MPKILLFFLLLPFMSTPLLAGGGEIQSKLDKLAKTLASGYETSLPGTEKISLAVLPFYTNKELAKTQTGVALAELLTHSFHQSAKFKVVERIEIVKILDELKLGMSGIINTEDAVEVGRLGGAKLQVFGSMDKVGGRYHINARIVETGTGEVIATAHETLSAELFEEEAKPYLLPRSYQKIGFYWLYNERSIPTVAQPASRAYGGGTETIYPRSVTMHQTGGGIRYNPFKKIQLDLAGIYSSRTSNSGGTSILTNPPFYTSNSNLSFGLITYRMLINYEVFTTRRTRLYAGGGMITHQLYKSMHGSYSSPVFQVRYEVRPQMRISLGLAVNYELKVPKWSIAHVDDGIVFTPYTKSHQPDRLTIEPTIGIYF